MRRLSLSLASVFALTFAACDDHGHDGDGAANLQECFVEHHEDEGLSVNESIVVCCLDHVIAGHTEVCGATAAECVTYVSAELDDASATTAEIDASCQTYETNL
jgi:hypothetical protein